MFCVNETWLPPYNVKRQSATSQCARNCVTMCKVQLAIKRMPGHVRRRRAGAREQGWGLASMRTRAMASAMTKLSVPMKVPSVAMPPVHMWMRSKVSESVTPNAVAHNLGPAERLPARQAPIKFRADSCCRR